MIREFKGKVFMSIEYNGCDDSCEKCELCEIHIRDGLPSLCLKKEYQDGTCDHLYDNSSECEDGNIYWILVEES